MFNQSPLLFRGIRNLTDILDGIGATRASCVSMPIKVSETATNYVLVASLPATIEKSNVSIKVDDGMVTIRAQKTSEDVAVEGSTVVINEFGDIDVKRVVDFGENLSSDASTHKAKFDTGRLTLTLQKAVQAEKNIDISVE
jgi:HSP20 family molecular chaperone IbpA